MLFVEKRKLLLAGFSKTCFYSTNPSRGSVLSPDPPMNSATTCGTNFMRALPRHQAGFASAGAAIALALFSASLRAEILFSDGDFGAQTIGSAVGTPWGPVGGGNTVTDTAQSPFTNVYPDNGKGAHFPASAANPYIVRLFADKAIPA